MSFRRVVAVCALSLLLTSMAFGAVKTYQVTGPVLEVRSDMIAVQKGKDRWEIARDPSTSMKGGTPKVGDKVLIEYRMTATSVEVKTPAAAKKK
ncbi:MAG TPA: hypothetical protein VGS98_08205 [Thermoanaerobaculia bacterium]|jgi:hypothetical protein|nr:hypothetical protein [Thermoanaerobaculia bacterium]